VARIHILTDDLLFGSRLHADLAGHGHAVSIGLEPAGDAQLLVLDLTSAAAERLDALALARPPALAFYSHVEQGTRELADRAGVEVVVPRSRIAREAPALVARMLATAR
jgi:hypothetical protein